MYFWIWIFERQYWQLFREPHLQPNVEFVTTHLHGTCQHLLRFSLTTEKRTRGRSFDKGSKHGGLTSANWRIRFHNVIRTWALSHPLNTPYIVIFLSLGSHCFQWEDNWGIFDWEKGWKIPLWSERKGKNDMKIQGEEVRREIEGLLRGKWVPPALLHVMQMIVISRGEQTRKQKEANVPSFQARH